MRREYRLVTDRDASGPTDADPTPTDGETASEHTFDQVPENQREEFMTSLLQSFPEADVPRAVGVAVSGLPHFARHATVSELFNGLDEESRPGVMTSLLRGLPDQDVARTVGVAVGELPRAAQQQAASEVLAHLDFADRTDQVVQVMQSLPAASVGDAVEAGLASLQGPQLEATASNAFDRLPATAQKRIASGVLEPPDEKTSNFLWKVVVCSLIAVVVIFGVLTFVLIYQKKSAEAPLALATTALGGIVGLLSPGPSKG
jgi:hypothetical protein